MVYVVQGRFTDRAALMLRRKDARKELFWEEIFFSAVMVDFEALQQRWLTAGETGQRSIKVRRTVMSARTFMCSRRQIRINEKSGWGH